MLVSLALIAGNMTPSQDGPGIEKELSPPGFEDPTGADDPIFDPAEGEDEDPDPFADFEPRSAWSGQLDLVAIVDCDRIDPGTRSALDVADQGACFIYSPHEAELSNVYVRLDGHPMMEWQALSREAHDLDRPPAAIVTSEFWIDEVMSTMATRDGHDGEVERAVLVDGRYASRELRMASTDPDAEFFVVSPIEEAQGPYDMQPFGEMVVGVPSHGDPWSVVHEYAQAPVDSDSAVGAAWWMAYDADGAWRHGADIGEGWEYSAIWFVNNPVD